MVDLVVYRRAVQAAEGALAHAVPLNALGQVAEAVASAVLKSIREPSPHMIEAGDDAIAGGWSAGNVWREMADIAICGETCGDIVARIMMEGGRG